MKIIEREERVNKQVNKDIITLIEGKYRKETLWRQEQ